MVTAVKGTDKWEDLLFTIIFNDFDTEDVDWIELGWIRYKYEAWKKNKLKTS